MNRRMLFSLAMLVGCASPVTPALEATPGRVLYTNARFYTLAETWADAMLTSGSDIEFVGSEEEARALADEATRRVDLNGAFVLPGLIDTHTHPGLVGTLQEDEADSGSEAAPRLPTRSKEELYAFLEAYSEDHFWQPFVTLGEWDVQMFLPDGPKKEDLDHFFKYRPALLFDNSGHSLWLNSMALWLLGIDEDTPDLSPGISYFVRDEGGEPTGWVKEFAAMPFLTDYLIPSKDELKAGIKEYLDFLSTRGVTYADGCRQLFVS